MEVSQLRFQAVSLIPNKVKVNPSNCKQAKELSGPEQQVNLIAVIGEDTQNRQ